METTANLEAESRITAGGGNKGGDFHRRSSTRDRSRRRSWSESPRRANRSSSRRNGDDSDEGSAAHWLSSGFSDGAKKLLRNTVVDMGSRWKKLGQLEVERGQIGEVRLALALRDGPRGKICRKNNVSFKIKGRLHTLNQVAASFATYVVSCTWLVSL